VGVGICSGFGVGVGAGVGDGRGVDVANVAGVGVGVGDNLAVVLVEPQAASMLVMNAIQSMVMMALCCVVVW
jgi:hypothetical protein